MKQKPKMIPKKLKQKQKIKDLKKPINTYGLKIGDKK